MIENTQQANVPEEPCASTKTEQPNSDRVISRAVFVVARSIVGFAGLLFCAIGAASIWGVAKDGADWWWGLIGPVFMLCGWWFLWSAIRPRREDVADIYTTIVARLLQELF